LNQSNPRGHGQFDRFEVLPGRRSKGVPRAVTGTSKNRRENRGGSPRRPKVQWCERESSGASECVKRTGPALEAATGIVFQVRTGDFDYSIDDVELVP
jgi:hypothetical protein